MTADTEKINNFPAKFIYEELEKDESDHKCNLLKVKILLENTSDNGSFVEKISFSINKEYSFQSLFLQKLFKNGKIENIGRFFIEFEDYHNLNSSLKSLIDSKKFVVEVSVLNKEMSEVKFAHDSIKMDIFFLDLSPSESNLENFISSFDKLLEYCRSLIIKDQSLSKDPTFQALIIECLVKKANYFTKDGNLKTVKASCDDLMKIFSETSTHILLELIKIHIEIRNFGEAESMCRNILKDDKENKEARAVLSKLIMEKKRCELHHKKLYNEIYDDKPSNSSQPAASNSFFTLKNTLLLLIFTAVLTLLISNLYFGN